MDELLKRAIDFNINKENKVKKSYNRWDFNMYLKKTSKIEDCFSTPFEISWQITGGCNLNCDYCYAKDLRKKPDLSTKKCHDIIEELAECKVYDVTLEGGEPFLRKDILELIQHIKEKKLWVDILTNGLLINEQIIMELKDLLDPRVDGLQISIDADGENGITQDLQNSIRLMIESGLNIRTNIVLTKENTPYLKKLYIQLLDLGVKNGFSISEIIPINGGNQIEKPTFKETLTAFLNLKEIESNKLPILGLPAILESSSHYMKLLTEKTGTVRQAERKHCSGGRIKANISCDGSVYPCAFLQYEEFLFGNIEDQQLRTIWNSEKANEYRHLLKNLDSCKGCPNKKNCPGGCFGATYAYHKDLSAPDPRCLSKGAI